MSYTPTEWATGDIVTAEKLNKIEGGIESINGLCSFSEGTLDKSYNDLLGMVNNGIIPFIVRGGYLYILGTLDIAGDGIVFRENTDSGFNVTFYAPNGDPDANLIAD